MRFVLLHYHFFKNAGTTIEEILAHSFGHFARLDSSDSETTISNAALLDFLNKNPEIQAVSSHHINYPMPQARGYLFFDICVLRDPIDRLRSIYDYFRQKHFPGVALSDLAQKTSLGEFFAELTKQAPFLINDVQVNLVANGEWDHPPGSDDLDRATRRILTASFLGVVDRFYPSLVTAEHALKPIFPTLNCAQPPANASAEKASLPERLARVERACGPEVYAELRRLNALDYELLDRARAEVMRRFQQVPDHGARLQALRAAVS